MGGIRYLSAEEYGELGFRCGLEIHQQLDTGQKLFCHCPVGLTDDEPDMRILRHMRPTLSELGEYDGTALMEFKTRKEVIYELFSDRTCTYEMDDTPPFPLNREALEIAIEVALLLNCHVVDEVHVTRKQYLDGSIPTGFQRTAVIGVDGWVPYRDRRIGIALLTLEEDACREVSDVGHTITFKTDRLSTPLVEVITAPDILTPHEAQEVNGLIGDLLRATGKVRRGIGSVRQDVNVSITGGTRVEIKGVPRIGLHPALTHIEAMRQKALLELAEECQRRGLSGERMDVVSADVTDLLSDTASPPVRKALDDGGVARAVRLGGWQGLLPFEVQPGRTFADEVAGRIRVVACIDRMPNLLHSDAPEARGGLCAREWRALEREVGARDGDAVAVVFGAEQDVATAAGEVEIRCREATAGVPSETRQVLDEGRTDFERILPGPNRMYPDTDTPPTAVSPESVAAIKARLPEPPWEREARYLRLGLSPQPAREMSRSEQSSKFDLVMGKVRTPPSLLAHLMLHLTKDLRRRGTGIESLAGDRWIEALNLVDRKVISRARLPELLIAMARYERVPAYELASSNGMTCLTAEEVESACDALVREWRGGDGLSREATERCLTGRLLERLQDRYPGCDAARVVETRLDAWENESERE